MAFPNLGPDPETGPVTTDDATWTITYPPDIAAGDLLLLFLAMDGAQTNAQSQGFTRISYSSTSSAVSLACYAKVAAGTESGTFVVTLGAAEQGVWYLNRIPAAEWFGGSPAIPTTEEGHDGQGVDTNITGGTSTAGVLASLNPALWAAEDTLWIGIVAIDTSRSITGFPTGYADNRLAPSSGGATGATLGIATADLNSATSPGGTQQFSWANSDEWVSITIGIRPAAGGAGAVLAGAIASSSSAAGTLRASVLLAGAPTLRPSSVTGALTTVPPVTLGAASSAGTSLVSAIGPESSLGGSAVGASSATGSLRAVAGLAGAIAGSSAAAGGLRVSVLLTGAIAGSSAATGSVRTVAGLAGASVGRATVAATLTLYVLALEIQFRSRGWDGSADTFGPWRSIECQALGAGWTRGNSEHRGLLNFPEATQANVQLRDPARELDPANEDGPWYGEIDVGADIRFVLGGREVFLGRITTLDHVLEPPIGPDPPLAIASIDALSYQGKLGLVNLYMINGVDPTFDFDEDTYTRINRILDYCDVPGGAARDIEAGGVMHWDYTIKQDNANAWDHVVMTMRSELGSLEVTPAGVIRTRNRNTVWGTSPPATLQLGCHAGAIPVHAAEFATVRDTVRNAVQAAWESINPDEGAPPIEDAASIAKYGKRSYSEDLTLMPDTTPTGTGPSAPHEAWKAFFLARMKSPMKQWRVEVRPTSQSQIDMIENVALFTGRARLTIDQHGPLIDETLRVVGMEWSVDPDASVCRIVLGAP